ncbi:MAG: EVE domain-containing protein [Vulcanimicrobiota bacterium]
MQYWLFKSEPDTFGLDDLKRMKKSPWDGVRNYMARNYLRAMKPGDLGFFYHSRVDPPGIAGVCSVASLPYDDFTALDRQSKYFDPKSSTENNRWSLVDVEYVEHFAHFVTLEELKNHPRLKDMVVTRKGNRLSISPVQPAEWKVILALGRGK